MAEMQLGKAVHSFLEAKLKGDSTRSAEAAGKRLTPADRKRFQRLRKPASEFVRRISDFKKQRGVRQQLVEHRLAIREDFGATGFSSKDALFRGIFDLALMWHGDKIAVVDHKSGVRFAMSSIAEQLEQYAVLAIANFPDVHKVWLGVHWVAHSEVEWTAYVTRRHTNQNFLPRLLDNIEAAALAVSDGPRENQGSWCQRCTYRSICPAVKDKMFERVEEDWDEFSMGVVDGTD